MTRDELLKRYANGDRDFRGANLYRANLSGANLTRANLTRANLTRANLTDANLTRANLTRANLTDANLTDANLTDANLTGANMTRAVGLPTARGWFDANLRRVEGGYEGYKTFGAYKAPNPAWIIEAGSVIEEPNYDPDRRIECAAGINCATRTWIAGDRNAAQKPVWRVFISDADIDAGDVCMPYATDGKFRARRITLLELEA